MTALVWTLQRRENPGLRFDDVNFKMGELEMIGDEAPAEPTAAVEEAVPGGNTAVMDPKDPSTVEEASTEDGLST